MLWPVTNSTSQSAPLIQLSADQGQFLRDGKPHQIISGAVHYFRIPADLWRDRLLRLKALGCNTVETYVAWNFHQPHADRPADFSGDRDLGRFLDLAAELDLDILVRPGPYICAEWDNGGLPAWLLADDRVTATLRTNDPDYLRHVDAWFDTLLPIVVDRQADRGGRVVGVQIENEYGSYGNDHDYLSHLRDGLLRRGVTALLFTSDGPTELMLSGGRVGEHLATVNFGSRQAESFALLDRLQPGRPGMCMEFWNGWFDHWGAEHHTRDAASAAAELKGMLADGRSVNLYMAHGGTSFGTWAGANASETGELQPTVSSYDYDSPIAEDGRTTAKFEAFRQVIAEHTGVTAPRPPADPQIQPEQTIAVTEGVDLQIVLDHVSPVRSATPQRFEHLGLHHGAVRYRTTITGPLTGMVRLSGLADLAEIRLDGRPVGRLGRSEIDPAYPSATDNGVEIAIGAGQHRLDVTVHSLGRINFGPYLGDRKGLGAIRLDYQHQFGFDHAALDLTAGPEFPGALWSSEPGDGPGCYRATVELDAVGDTHLELPGWHTGYLFLNGFNLGRYWNAVPPQRTLYAPAPLWRTGSNELVVVEFGSAGREIGFRARPVLG